MPQLELKSWRTFLAIKRCQRTKIRKVIKLEQSSKKSGDIYVTIAVKLLRQWFDVLERDQILILSYHELISDPMTFQQRIEEFLVLPNSGKLTNVTTKKNVKSFPGKDAVVSCRSRNKLAAIFQPYVDANALNHPSVARLKHWVLR